MRSSYRKSGRQNSFAFSRFCTTVSGTDHHSTRDDDAKISPPTVTPRIQNLISLCNLYLNAIPYFVADTN